MIKNEIFCATLNLSSDDMEIETLAALETLAVLFVGWLSRYKWWMYNISLQNTSALNKTTAGISGKEVGVRVDRSRIVGLSCEVLGISRTASCASITLLTHRAICRRLYCFPYVTLWPAVLYSCYCLDRGRVLELNPDRGHPQRSGQSAPEESSTPSLLLSTL